MTNQQNNLDGSISRISILVSLSCVLQICESLIPHPVPGLRLGLANVVTLITLDTLGFACALEVTILRTLLSSFIMGTFMSPAFILSFCSGIASTLVMGLLYWFSGFHGRYGPSLIGISIIGALSHNLVQTYLAYLVLIRHPGIFVFLPWLCMGSLITGWITGITAVSVCRTLKSKEANEGLARVKTRKEYGVLSSIAYQAGNSLVHQLGAKTKLISVLVLSLAALIFNQLWPVLILSFLLIILTICSQTSPVFLYSRARKYLSLVLISFFLPLFFTSGRHVLSQMAYFKITTEGLNAGALFAWRIIFFILLNSLLSRTTPLQELSCGLAALLSPLRPMGISNTRIAAILSSSWVSVPLLWDTAKEIISKAELRKVRDPVKLVPLLSNFITQVYLEAEDVKPLTRKEETKCAKC